MSDLFCPNCNTSISSHMKKCPKCKSVFQPVVEINDDLYKGTDNIWFKSGCPALMNDGRFTTYYTPAHELTEQMRQNAGYCDHHDFQIFLQKNATKLMDAERRKLFNFYNCRPAFTCSDV